MRMCRPDAGNTRPSADGPDDGLTAGGDEVWTGTRVSLAQNNNVEDRLVCNQTHYPAKATTGNKETHAYHTRALNHPIWV